MDTVSQPLFQFHFAHLGRGRCGQFGLETTQNYFGEKFWSLTFLCLSFDVGEISEANESFATARLQPTLQDLIFFLVRYPASLASGLEYFGSSVLPVLHQRNLLR